MEAELPKAAHSPSLRKLQSCSLQVTHRDPRLLRALTAGGTEGSRIQLSFKDNFVFKKSFEVIVLGLKKVEENHKSSRTSLQTDTAQPLMLTRGLGKGSVKEQGQWWGNAEPPEPSCQLLFSALADQAEIRAGALWGLSALLPPARAVAWQEIPRCRDPGTGGRRSQLHGLLQDGRFLRAGSARATANRFMEKANLGSWRKLLLFFLPFSMFNLTTAWPDP